MIKGVTGKPGAGKSMYTVRWIIDELRATKRLVFVSSRLGLKVNELAQYLLENYGSTFDVYARVRILTDEQCREFWKHRQDTKGWVEWDTTLQPLPPGTECYKLENGKVLAYVKIAGCVFILDECHRYFSSIESADPGYRKRRGELLEYVSQHRHYGDDVIFITQHLAFLDKTFLRIAQDFVELRNWGKEKWGPFLPPKRFKWFLFLTPPTMPNATSTTDGDFKLDVEGISKLYDTAAADEAVGLRLADTTAKRSGISLYWLPVFFIGVCVLLYWGVHLFGAATNHVVASGIRSVAGATNAIPHGSQERVGDSEVPYSVRPLPASYVKSNLLARGKASQALQSPYGPKRSTSMYSPVDDSPTDELGVYVTGVQKIGDQVSAFLSDGRVYRSGDPDLLFIGTKHIIVSEAQTPVVYKLLTLPQSLRLYQATQKTEPRPVSGPKIGIVASSSDNSEAVAKTTSSQVPVIVGDVAGSTGFPNN